MDEIKRLEDLYAGAADRRQAGLPERLGLLGYRSRRAEELVHSRLFGCYS